MNEPLSSADHQNAILCYEYAQIFLNSVDQSLNETSRKLTATMPCSLILCIAGAVIQFNSLPLQWISLMAATLSLLSCVCGLLPASVKGAVSVDELLTTDWYYRSDEDFRRYVAGAWRDVILESKKLQSKRSRLLVVALGFLFISSISISLGVL